MADVSRRDFLNALGVTVGAAATVPAGILSGPAKAEAAEPPKGKIPSTPYKVGHMTFFSGPAAILGEPSYKGHILAAEEINAQGGLLGKRKIETVKADEAAGTDANVKELRRMKLSEKIELMTGVISSGNTPALGPVAEELKLLTIFVDGCTDFLFDKAVPNPHHIFRITNIQSADGVTAAVATALDAESIEGTYGKPEVKTFDQAFNKVWQYPTLGVTVFYDKDSAVKAIRFSAGARRTPSMMELWLPASDRNTASGSSSPRVAREVWLAT